MLAEWTGSYQDSMRFAERAIELGRKLRLPEVIIFSTWFVGKARCCLGDFGGAIALLEEAHQTCVRIGDRAWRSRMLNTLGWCFSEIGSTARAREHNELAATLARELGDPEILSNAAINLASNHLALDDKERAAEYLATIEEALSQTGDPWMRWRYSLHVMDTRARIDLAGREYDRALALAEEQLAGAHRHQAPKIEVRALSLKGQALLEIDRRAEAEEAFRSAAEIAERIGFARGLWNAYAFLAEYERRSGNNTVAGEHARKVREVAERAAATLSSPELRFRLIASAVR
jgi:tetratricopeptide (TPR) repeat protein